MSVVLITGAATGIGNLTARSLAQDGHIVYASMRNLASRNANHANELLDMAQRDDVDIRVVELDVQSQDSADSAVKTILNAAGQLDVVVHNAGHLYIGYAEAFTAEDIARLFDINVIGLQRVNRAVLPHMRERRSGTLIYVGSTSTISVPPFLGPYVASKAAFDALAHTTAYEVAQFGIETTIVMPGAFTKGTEHYPNASRASDEETTRAYAALDSMVARSEEAAEGLFRPDVDADPVSVAREITDILALPVGAKPFRSVIDFTDAGVPELSVEAVNLVARRHQESFISRMGFGELLELRP
jgi:NAD(P)-dependent dehydrogenase (short-subunit alcohol dehydrogenase family)